MKIFTDRQDYPHSKHICSTLPCSTLFIYTNSILLEIPSLFYFKFSSTPDLSLYSKSQKPHEFFKSLEKKLKEGTEI